MKATALCIAVFCLLAAKLSASLLVVSGESAKASDDNPGTEENPLKTISAAAAKVRAGDKVVVHHGDYRETVIITASGTAEAPIIFEAAPSETPVIKGSDLIRLWERDAGDVWKSKLPALPQRGSSGKEASFWRTNDVRQIFTRDGVLQQAERLQRVGNRDEMRAGAFFCDVETSTLYLWLADGGSPAEHPPEVALRGGWLSIFGSHVTVRGFAMRHASTSSLGQWAGCNLLGDHSTVENCSITWGDFAGCALSGNHNCLRNSVIACNGNSGVAGTGEGHLMEGCRATFNNVDRYMPDWHAGGAKLIPRFQHSIIRHNEFARNLGPGLWLDAECNENIIDGNFFHDNEGPGLMVEVSSGNLVTNNITVANRNFLSGPFRNNAGKEDQFAHSEERIAPHRAFKMYHAGDGRGIFISSSPMTKVLHNTAYLNEGEGICVEGAPRGAFTTHGCFVVNNISVFNHGSQLTLRPDSGENENSRSIADYNLLFSVGAVLAKNGWDGLAAVSMNDWRKLSGQDAHSIDADPRFAMAAMDDFRLFNGSPALQSGKALTEVDHDYFGRRRDRERTTIGACEAPAQIYPLPIWNVSEGGTMSAPVPKR